MKYQFKIVVGVQNKMKIIMNIIHVCTDKGYLENIHNTKTLKRLQNVHKNGRLLNSSVAYICICLHY